MAETINRDIPAEPKIINENGTCYSVCPNCGGKLVYGFDENDDCWYYNESCIFCHQRILDRQRSEG